MLLYPVLYGTYVQYNLEPVILTLLLRSLSREWKNKKPLTFSVMAKPLRIHLEVES